LYHRVSDESSTLQLHQLLEELSSLNGGKAVNPRSPKQVSDLLYRYNNGFIGSGSRGGGGGTDKNTLLSIIHSQGSHDDGAETTRQKRIAQLILDCREILSTSSNNINSSGGGGGFSCLNEKMNSAVGSHKVKYASFSSVASPNSGIEAGECDGGKEDAIHTSSDATIESTGTETDGYNNNQAMTTLDDTTSRDLTIFDSPITPYERMVQSLFSNETEMVEQTVNNNDSNENNPSQLDIYWMDPLLSLRKSSAVALVRQLHRDCPMGYDPNAIPAPLFVSTTTTTATSSGSNKKETPHLSFLRTQKRKHFPDAVLLVRVGDFYETYGVDAILLVEHAGLNPMGGKARAGCPWRK
jgi:hypothetical protein